MPKLVDSVHQSQIILAVNQAFWSCVQYENNLLNIYISIFIYKYIFYVHIYIHVIYMYIYIYIYIYIYMHIINGTNIVLISLVTNHLGETSKFYRRVTNLPLKLVTSVNYEVRYIWYLYSCESSQLGYWRLVTSSTNLNGLQQPSLVIFDVFSFSANEWLFITYKYFPKGDCLKLTSSSSSQLSRDFLIEIIRNKSKS